MLIQNWVFTLSDEGTILHCIYGPYLLYLFICWRAPWLFPVWQLWPNFGINMDGTGGDYAEWNKSSREIQLSYGFPYLRSIGNNVEDIGRWKGEECWGKPEGERNHEKLWTLRNKLRILEGRGLWGWVSQVVGIKKGMYCMEHWGRCVNNEFWNTKKKIKLKKKEKEIKILVKST